jgi:F-type H+-transporting ATPase subunit b
VQIDWFTLVAQIVNFLVLIGLLKYFLYDRILRVADEREAQIADRFEEAEQAKKAAHEEAETYREKQRDLENEREELISEAREEAAARRQELLKKARHEVEEAQTQWYDAIQREKEVFLQDLRSRAGQQIYSIARRALADLADAELEQRIVQAFMERIGQLDDDTRDVIARSIGDSGKNVVIRSAFEIPDDTRRNLVRSIQDQWGDSVEGEFQTSSDLVAGIELQADGYQIAWSLQDYLAGLEEDMSQIFEEELRRRRDSGEHQPDDG